MATETDIEPDRGRSVGPVTTSAGVGAALAYIVCAALGWAGLEVTAEFQGATAVVLVVLGGWIVKPRTTSKGRYSK